MYTTTRIKICGITSLNDALMAIDCGADALGFIFVKESPRYIGGDFEAVRIPLHLPPFVSKVAVYRNADCAHDYWENYFDCLQFYSNDWRTGAPPQKRLVQAFRIKDESSLDEIAVSATEAHALLLDTWNKDVLGGSGETFNWDLARAAKERFRKPIILAGGLTPDNVGEAIHAVRPYAVDISSGVEAEPGRKDPDKVRAFCDAVRKADIG